MIFYNFPILYQRIQQEKQNQQWIDPMLKQFDRFSTCHTVQNGSNKIFVTICATVIVQYQFCGMSDCHLNLKCHLNPSIICTHFTQNHKCKPCVGSREKARGSLKSLQFLLLGTMNVCTKFHHSPSNSCWDNSVWTEVVDRSNGWLMRFSCS